GNHENGRENGGSTSSARRNDSRDPRRALFEKRVKTTTGGIVSDAACVTLDKNRLARGLADHKFPLTFWPLRIPRPSALTHAGVHIWGVGRFGGRGRGGTQHRLQPDASHV